MTQVQQIQLVAGDSRALVTPFGAQVISFQRKGQETLWLSEKVILDGSKPIRGGLPLCWPWFGPHATDSSKPGHGFARNSLWQVVSQTADSLLLELTPNTLSQNIFPYAFKAQLEIKLSDVLELALTTQNLDSQPFDLTQAYHSYLSIEDMAKVRVSGVNANKLQDKLTKSETPFQQDTLTDLVPPFDQVYWGQHTAMTLSSGLPALSMESKAMDAMVVWNPGAEGKFADIAEDAWQDFICVEAAQLNPVTLQPGESFTFDMTLAAQI